MKEPITVQDPDLHSQDIKSLVEEIVNKLKAEGSLAQEIKIRACIVRMPAGPPAINQEVELSLTIYLDNGQGLECTVQSTLRNVH